MTTTHVPAGGFRRADRLHGPDPRLIEDLVHLAEFATPQEAQTDAQRRALARELAAWADDDPAALQRAWAQALHACRAGTVRRAAAAVLWDALALVDGSLGDQDLPVGTT